MILKHCDVQKEEASGHSEESPLTSFSQLMSPTRPPSTAAASQKDTNLILPENLPIDLRVKIVVCLIHLRQLHMIKVRVPA